MDGLGAGLAGGGQDLLGDQVALARRGRADQDGDVGLHHERSLGVRLGIDRDRPHAQLTGGADDPTGDFAAIGDEDGRDQRNS
jgi:hypothetical protein